MEKNKIKKIETSNDAALKWRSEIDKEVNKTLIPESKNSWLYGGNVAGKANIFMPYPGGLPKYREICRKIAKDNYEAFDLS